MLKILRWHDPQDYPDFTRQFNFMKIPFVKRLALAALICAASPAFAKSFTVQTKSFAVNFQTGGDGRLYQQPIGADSKVKFSRDDEFYPQAGDGYIWEPALQVVHADGNTSTDLRFENVTQTNESPDITLAKIELRDPAYPFEVTIFLRAQRDEDLIEQWEEIRHQESGPVTA